MFSQRLIFKSIIYLATFILMLVWFLAGPELGLAQGIGTAGQNAGLTGWQLTVYNMLTTIGAMFAWIGGFLLDASIAVFVANMAGASSAMGLTSVVVALWQVIRDLVNLIFIFSLIWIGFQTILGTGGANTKKWVANLVIAALLINFSLYITQVVIDFSNVAAFQISQLMQTETREDPIFGVEIGKISSGFVAKTNLQNFPSGSQEALVNLMGPNSGFDGFMAALAFGFVVMLMLIIMGFVFAAGAVILFTRFIVLTFVMIFSPLLFLNWIFPNLGKYGSRVFKELISQSLVGPVFLFMLYISYRALEGFSQIGEDGMEYTITNILVYFIVVIGFVCASLIAAKSFGGYGASQAISMGKSLDKWARVRAGNATFGTTAAFMRSTVGNLAQRGAESNKLLDRAAGSGFGGWAARRQLNALRTVGNSSMDARKVAGVGKSLGIGEGAKGGYKTMRDNYAKAKQEYGEKLGEVDDDDKVVKGYKDTLEKSESELELLKRKKRNAPEAEKASIQLEIDDKEKTIKEAKGNMAREKARRQIGSVAFAADKEKIDADLVKQKNMRADYVKLYYTAANNEERDFAVAGYTAARKEIAKLNKQLRQGGYANTLKNSAILASLFSGALPSFNAKAGKDLTKKYEKKFKETEDDKRIASVVDAVKSSAAKDKDH